MTLPPQKNMPVTSLPEIGGSTPLQTLVRSQFISSSYDVKGCVIHNSL